MEIFNENIQPFGLLSNFATTPFTLGGQTWDTVNEYIYVNAVKDPEAKAQLRRLSGLSNMGYRLEELHREASEKLYKKFVLKGYTAAIDANPAAIRTLSLVDRVTYPDNPELQAFLNDKARQLRAVSYADEYTLTRVKRVVDGVERALKTGVKIDPDSTFVDLLKYESNVPSRRPDDDPALERLDELVPFIAYERETAPLLSKYNQELSIFKKTLLDEFLNYVLEVDYPDVDAADYAEAKDEQIKRLIPGDYDSYIDKTYQEYVKGRVPREVIDKLKMEPPRYSAPEYVPVRSGFLRVDGPGHPLFAFKPDPIDVDGIRYRSLIHYVYQKLFDDIEEGFDVSVIPPEYLSDEYGRYSNFYIREDLIENARQAIDAKFRQHPVLIHLLKRTEGPLIWMDSSDPVLGIGERRNGENIVGQLLEDIRSRRGKIPVRRYANLVDNVYLWTWILNGIKDAVNAKKLITDATVQDLAELYGCSYSDKKFDGLSKRDVDAIRSVMPLSDADLVVVWQLLWPRAKALASLDDENQTIALVSSQQMYVDAPVSDGGKNLVKKFFNDYYAKNAAKMVPGNAAIFIDAVLSVTRGSTVTSTYNIFANALPPRIAYWESLAKKMVSV